MSLKCLVTGGLGFIGSNLVEKLREFDYDITVWDIALHSPEQLSGFVSGPASSITVDNIDVSQLGAIPHRSKLSKARSPRYGDSIDREFDVIFHLAALSRIQPSFDDPKGTHDTNVTGTVEILELAKRCGAKVVYAGSSSFYYDPYANPYAYTKWVGEEYCKLYNNVYDIPVAIARFFNVYGPGCTVDGPYSPVVAIFEDQIVSNKPLTITGTGEQRRDFIHVHDIVDGLIAMSFMPQSIMNADIFNLGSGKNISINELAEMFDPKNITYIPARQGEADASLADISLAKQKLGWEPKIDIKEYIKEL
jgi:UDP-glucose 4-epimerase